MILNTGGIGLVDNNGNEMSVLSVEHIDDALLVYLHDNTTVTGANKAFADTLKKELKDTYGVDIHTMKFITCEHNVVKYQVSGVKNFAKAAREYDIW